MSVNFSLISMPNEVLVNIFEQIGNVPDWLSLVIVNKLMAETFTGDRAILANHVCHKRIEILALGYLEDINPHTVKKIAKIFSPMLKNINYGNVLNQIKYILILENSDQLNKLNMELEKLAQKYASNPDFTYEQYALKGEIEMRLFEKKERYFDRVKALRGDGYSNGELYNAQQALTQAKNQLSSAEKTYRIQAHAAIKRGEQVAVAYSEQIGKAREAVLKAQKNLVALQNEYKILSKKGTELAAHLNNLDSYLYAKTISKSFDYVQFYRSLKI